jgi:hypothetical protein
MSADMSVYALRCGIGVDCLELVDTGEKPRGMEASLSWRPSELRWISVTSTPVVVPEMSQIRDFPPRYSIVASGIAKSAIEKAGVSGYEWIDVNISGSVRYILNIINNIKCLDENRSVFRKSIHGYVNGGYVSFVEGVVNSKDFFVSAEHPMVGGPYIGQEGAELLIRARVPGLILVPVWRKDQQVIYASSFTGTANPVVQGWRELEFSQDMVRRSRLGLVNRALGILGLASLEELSGSNLVERIEDWVNQWRARGEKPSDEEVVSVGSLYCEAFHLFGGWSWALLSHNSVSGNQVAVVSATRSHAVIADSVIQWALEDHLKVPLTLEGSFTMAVSGTLRAQPPGSFFLLR